MYCLTTASSMSHKIGLKLTILTRKSEIWKGAEDSFIILCTQSCSQLWNSSPKLYCFCSLCYFYLATMKKSLVSAPPRTPPPRQRAQPRARVRAARELRGPRGLTAGQWVLGCTLYMCSTSCRYFGLSRVYLPLNYYCLRSRPIYLNVVSQSVRFTCSKFTNSNVLILTY